MWFQTRTKQAQAHQQAHIIFSAQNPPFKPCRFSINIFLRTGRFDPNSHTTLPTLLQACFLRKHTLVTPFQSCINIWLKTWRPDTKSTRPYSPTKIQPNPTKSCRTSTSILLRTWRFEAKSIELSHGDAFPKKHSPLEPCQSFMHI